MYSASKGGSLRISTTSNSPILLVTPLPNVNQAFGSACTVSSRVRASATPSARLKSAISA